MPPFGPQAPTRFSICLGGVPLGGTPGTLTTFLGFLFLSIPLDQPVRFIPPMINDFPSKPTISISDP
jgi:hypothetical protein